MAGYVSVSLDQVTHLLAPLGIMNVSTNVRDDQVTGCDGGCNHIASVANCFVYCEHVDAEIILKLMNKLLHFLKSAECFTMTLKYLRHLPLQQVVD